MSAGSLLPPPERVLSTLERDGSRRWLQPRLSKGRLLDARRIVAYLLIATYTLLPLVHVGGKPFVLLDIAARRFTIFGYTFLPTDTLLLALALVGVLVGVFFVSALFGRVWCGWACPQTVYLEFVFRPIERLFNGTPGRGGAPRKPPSGLMTSLRFLVYTAIAFVLANTFLAYFVGIDTLLDWMQRSPLQHPVSFFVMSGLTAAMLVNFAYFREQLCILACPYGRLQSVLLDKDSSIVSYDALRGDPRGKARKAAAATTLGDCVDCRLCVTTCPTGIDIRDGLQMECINCTQCIDACNAVMHKLGRRPNLIRYSSQNADAGAPRRLLRPRLVIYSLVMVVLATLFVVTLSGGQSFDAVILRNTGQPYSLTETGDVRNVVRLKTTNRSDAERRLWVTVVEPSDVTLHGADDPFVLREGEANTFPLAVVAAPELFVTGQVRLQLRVESDDGDAQSVQFTLLGPMPRPTETP